MMLTDLDFVLLQQCRLVAFVMLLIVGGHSAVSPGMQMTFQPPQSVQIKEKWCAVPIRSGETTDLAQRALSPPRHR